MERTAQRHWRVRSHTDALDGAGSADAGECLLVLVWLLFEHTHRNGSSDVTSLSAGGVSQRWRAYMTVNRRFAQQIMSTYNNGDLVWIHGYHLLMTPRYLSTRGVFMGRVGLFLHTPFPSSEVGTACCARVSSGTHPSPAHPTASLGAPTRCSALCRAAPSY